MVRKRAAVIMAAGKGTRMKDPSRAKVMYEILGRPMVHYVVDLAYEMRMDRIIAIVGWQKDVVANFLRSEHPDVEIAEQNEQLGTGHAVMQTEHLLRGFDGDIVVLSGDVPLLLPHSMNELIEHHHQKGAVGTILTANVDDPSGYGRIIRNDDGLVERIVEHKDASEEERRICEINSGIYCFQGQALYDSLNHITPHNVQNEYYLTDVFGYLRTHGKPIGGLPASHPDEIQGVNTLEQLDQATTILKARS